MQLFLCENHHRQRILPACWVSASVSRDLSAAVTSLDRAVGHLLETASPEAYGEQYGRPWRADVLPVLPETGNGRQGADKIAVHCYQ